MTYGSIQNRIKENYGQKDFDDIEIGMGVTRLMWSDRYAYTVVEKIEGGIVGVTRDREKQRNSAPHYQYFTNWFAERVWLKKDRSGRWGEVRINPETGRWNKVRGFSCSFGERETYFDPHF